MEKLYLDGQWKFYEYGKTEALDASVPGCVHTDLINNGVIKDIFYRDNNRSLKWIEEKEWIYEREFNVDKTENAVIVFEGLDVYCDVLINGILIGKCENMFIEHRFNIEKALKVGDNNIKVRFYPPARQVEGRRDLPGAFTRERLHTRRMQCTYGWDWVARFVTCGIYRSVYIMYDEKVRCDSVYVYTTHLDKYGAQISAMCEFVNYSTGDEALIEVISPDGKILFKRRAYINMPQYRVDVSIENPLLWDISNNDNIMYTFRVSFGDEVFEEKFGIRTVRVIQKTDEEGSESYNLCKKLKETTSGKEYDFNEEFSSFEVVLNGRKVMCKGANWVPCEPFASSESDEKITKILTMAKEMGLNIVRVWGGGLFEKRHFYDECDRLGIMLVQDFLMACGKYPEDEEWFIDNLKKEAEYATKKLRNHPSLIWWHGDNENAIEGSDYKEDYKGRSSAVFGAMPSVYKNDYTRMFLMSSPWGGDMNASKTVGTTHNTQFLGCSIFPYFESDDDGNNYLEDYKEYTARFISEEPCFGASPLLSLRKIMTDDDIFNDEEMWLYHTQGNPDLNKELIDLEMDYAKKLFSDFKDGKDKLFKFQYLQYEYIRFSMENARRNRGFCNGMIYWMLNDCWPTAAGWSIIDYYCVPKAGYYSFKNYASDLIVSFDRKDEKLLIYLCNDSDADAKEVVTVDEIDIASGKTVNTYEITLESKAQTSVYKEVSGALIDEGKVFVADCRGVRTFYKQGGLKIKECSSVELVKVDKDSVTVKADKYTHAVELYGDCIFEDNFFSLKSGEERTVKFKGSDKCICINSYNVF